MQPPNRLRLAVGFVCAIAGCLALASCKDKQAPSSTPGSGAGSEAASSSVTSAFDKPRKPTGPLTIRMITNNSSSFWAAMELGMKEATKEVDIASAERLTPQGASPTHNDQKVTFEQAVAANVDGIGVSPIEAKVFAPVIDSAIDKGIPVITFDSDSDTSKRLVYLGTNNYEAGRRAGEQAVRLLPNGGKFIAFVGNMTAQNARDRYRGFLDAIKGHNIEPLQDPLQDKADKTGAAYNNVNDAITRYGDKINLMLGIWSYNGPAIVDVVQQRKVRDRTKIVCFDGDAKTLSNLANGLVDATVVQKPYEFGRLGTKLLYYINRKGLKAALATMKPELDKLGMKIDGNKIDTGVTVVTPQNAAPFLKEMKEKGLEST